MSEPVRVRLTEQQIAQLKEVDRIISEARAAANSLPLWQAERNGLLKGFRASLEFPQGGDFTLSADGTELIQIVPENS